jgi:hypothetical protein
MNIDFELLREQKEWLIAIRSPSAFRRFNQVGTLQARNWEMAEGLLHLLDALQDDAIQHGHTVEEVYGCFDQPDNHPH